MIQRECNTLLGIQPEAWVAGCQLVYSRLAALDQCCANEAL